MENNNFEQQFVQNVKSNVSEASQPSIQKTESAHKAIFIIAVIISIISLIESVILAAALVNFTSTMAHENDPENGVDEAAIITNSPYVWDDEGNLTAVGITCKNKDNSSFVLTKTNKFTAYDNLSHSTETGNYSIVNDSLISLSGSDVQERVLYYDGFTLADGINIYDCEE